MIADKILVARKTTNNGVLKYPPQVEGSIALSHWADVIIAIDDNGGAEIIKDRFGDHRNAVIRTAGMDRTK